MSSPTFSARSAAAPLDAPDLTFVTPRLAIGGRLPDRGAESLVKGLALRRIVDLRLEARDDEDALGQRGARLLHLPTEDLCAISPADLETGVRWVRDALDAHERVLIHCEHGIGRSALLTACVLVSEGRSAAAALQMCKSARARVCPSPAQLEALVAFAASAHAADHVRPSTFRELAAIAYADLLRG